jgi:hypothetical protein
VSFVRDGCKVLNRLSVDARIRWLAAWGPHAVYGLTDLLLVGEGSTPFV